MHNFIQTLLLYLTPKFLKIIFLKQQGKIGKHFSLGFKSMIKTQKLNIGKNVYIGKNVIIVSDYVTIGDRVRIEDNSFIKAKNGVHIGKDSYIENDNIIGGMQSAESYIEIGERVGIFPKCFINTTKKVIIKNDVGIGGESLIFTHGTWQNILEGYPYSFGDVILEKNVWLPWRVFILPNVTIGENTTIGSASVISSNIPANCFAAGVPCKVIKEQNKKESTPEFRFQKIELIFKELIIDFKKLHGIDFLLTSYETNKKLELSSEKINILYTSDLNKAEEFIGFVLCDFEYNSNRPNWASLKSYKTKYPENKYILMVLNFLQQYGIRFNYI